MEDITDCNDRVYRFKGSIENLDKELNQFKSASEDNFRNVGMQLKDN